MEKIEVRTLVRTVFSKLKSYYKYRKNKIRLKIRANVHCRIKLASFVINRLRNYKETLQYKKKKIEIAYKHTVSTLLDKSFAGLLKNIIENNQKKKIHFKSQAFFKYSYLYKSMLAWKNYKKVLAGKIKILETCSKHNENRLKKYFFTTFRIILDENAKIGQQKLSLTRTTR